MSRNVFANHELIDFIFANHELIDFRFEIDEVIDFNFGTVGWNRSRLFDSFYSDSHTISTQTRTNNRE